MIHSVQCVANLFLLFLSRPEGQIISVPHYNIQIPLPSKGEVVTFSYEVSTRRELPVNPVITKIRGDITWEDVLLSHLTELKLQNTGTLLWILLYIVACVCREQVSVAVLIHLFLFRDIKYKWIHDTLARVLDN